MKALQRQRREQLIGADVLAGVWHGIATDIAAAEVRPIPYAEARDLIEHHDPGTMPVAVRHCYGIFFGDRLGGAVAYGTEYGENRGIWDRYGYTGRIIALLRGVSAHWAHEHTGSKLIGRSMVLLPPQYKVITATVDPQLGEIGTVYQAAGFDYVGQMWKGIQLRIHDGDRVISERSARRKYGTGSAVALEARGLKVERVPRRERYFAFRGSRAEQKTLRAAIADRIQPYPKRVIKFRPCGPQKHIGFVCVRRRRLKDGGEAVTFDLKRSMRVDGKPRHEFVMTLGSQRSDRDHAGFLVRVNERMARRGLDQAQRRRVIADRIKKGGLRSIPA